MGTLYLCVWVYIHIYTHGIVYTMYGKENEQQNKEKLKWPIWIQTNFI